MIVYALSGASGTGKSTSSLAFAHQKNIPAIIDDGLLIYKGKKIAGTSAKFEKNYITAVKRATFHLKAHRQEVLHALKHYAMKKILIIGTSKKMVDKIASTLQLGPIHHYIDITEIRTSSEIKMAQYVRQTQGKHVIPIPYGQVEQSFFRKLISHGKKIFSPKREYIGETTIVHPDFTKGIIHISNKVLKSIAKKEAERVRDIQECTQILLEMHGLPTIQIHVQLHHPMQRPLQSIATEAQENIVVAFQNYLGLEVETIQVYVEK